MEQGRRGVDAGRGGIAVVGAASSIGIRPYDDRREPRRLYEAPQVLRSLGLVARLDADDLGDVAPPAYVDFERVPGVIRNEAGLVEYSRALAARVEEALTADRFALVLGGDCSIVLGALLGAVRHAGPVALAYLDGHADFALPAESYTGSAASMCLGLAVGRGDSPLARLGRGPLVQGQDVVLIGRRDEGEPYGHGGIGPAGLLDLTGEALRRDGPDAIAQRALERLVRPALGGFWIHLDADLLDGAVMPAVDSPEPDGPDVDTVAALLAPLVAHPRALGLQVTIYDPGLDPERSAGRTLCTLLERVLAPRVAPVAA